MTTYYTLVITGVALIAVVRAWYRRARANQAAQDDAALKRYGFATRFSSPALAAPHDEARARAARTRAAKVDQRQRKAAAARIPKPASRKADNVGPQLRRAK